MKQFEDLNREELLYTNGGSEESYSWGYKIGNFLGAMTSNALQAMDAFADGVREGIEAIRVLKS